MCSKSNLSELALLIVTHVIYIYKGLNFLNVYKNEHTTATDTLNMENRWCQSD